MRTRIRLPLAASGRRPRGVLVRRPCVRAGRRGGDRVRRRRGRGVRTSSSKTAATVDDCQEAPNPLVPVANEIIWGTLAFLVLLVGMWKCGLPGGARHDARRARSASATTSSAPSRRRPRPKVCCSSYQAQLADARNEAGRIIDEARQAAEQVRRDVIARAEEEANEIAGPRPGRHRLAARACARRSCGPRWRRCRSSWPSRIVERNLDSDTQPPARRQLHRRGREQLSDGRSRRGLRAVAARRSPKPKDTSARSKTSCSGSRVSSRATTSCAWRSATGRCPPSAAWRSSRSCSSTARCRRRRRSSSFIVGDRPRPRPRRDRAALRRARGVDAPARGRRGPLGATPLDDEQVRRLAEALSQATGKHVEVKVVVDEKVMGGLVATIGDTVIDGTVRHRLAQLKETI